MKWWSPLREGLLMFGTPMRDNLTVSPGWIPEGIWRSFKPSTVSTWNHVKISISIYLFIFWTTPTSLAIALEKDHQYFEPHHQYHDYTYHTPHNSKMTEESRENNTTCQIKIFKKLKWQKNVDKRKKNRKLHFALPNCNPFFCGPKSTNGPKFQLVP